VELSYCGHRRAVISEEAADTAVGVKAVSSQSA
jgi:hypothetical protein